MKVIRAGKTEMYRATHRVACPNCEAELEYERSDLLIPPLVESTPRKGQPWEGVAHLRCGWCNYSIPIGIGTDLFQASSPSPGKEGGSVAAPGRRRSSAGGGAE